MSGAPLPNVSTGSTDAPLPLLIDAAAAAKALSISSKLLWTLTKSGEIPVCRVGRRVLYRPSDLSAWIAARMSGGRP